MYRQFKETLLSTVNESMENQKQLLDQKLKHGKVLTVKSMTL